MRFYMKFGILRVAIEENGDDHIRIANGNRAGESFFKDFFRLMFVIKIGFHIQAYEPVVRRDGFEGPVTHSVGFKRLLFRGLLYIIQKASGKFEWAFQWHRRETRFSSECRPLRS